MPENKSNNPSNSTSKYVLKTADFEGFEPSVYKDTKGKKTIGYGFNLDDKYVQNYLKNIGYNVNKLISGKVSLNESESKTILSDLYNKSYQAASKIVKNFKELPEEVQHTLADLNYNLGTTKLRGFKRMLSALEKRDYKTAAEELKNSDYYTQTGRRAKSHYEKLKTITDSQKKTEEPKQSQDLSTFDFLKSAYVGLAPSSPFLPNYTTLLKIKESLPFFQAAPESKVQPEEETYAQGGEVKNNKYSSIPRTGLRYPNIMRVPAGQRSFYDPVEETIYLADGEDPTVVQHEMFHHWQKLNNNLSVGPVNKPPIMSADPGSFYNRRQADIEDASSKFFKKNPSFLNIPFDLVYNKEVEPAMYYYPEYAEGEAEEYQNYINQGGEPVFPSYAKGGLIKRADGSYSKRGLWDNIRANRGSGRRPTKEMLRQEKKIRAAEKKEDGGPVYNWIPPNYPRVGARNEHGGWLDEYEYGGSIEDQRIPIPAQYEFGLKYADNNSPTLTTNQMGTPRAYAHGATVFTKQTTPSWVAGTPTPTTTQRDIAFNRSFSPGTAVPYPEVKIPASAYTPASPPVLQGYNPYNGPMRLHAPDTTQIARDGGRVTKKAGIPYAIYPGTSDAGMYVGPTTQRGITFGNGGRTDVPPASRQDSISLLNSVNALNKYYQTSGFHEPQPYVFSPSYFNTQAGRASLNQEEEENIRQYNYMLKDFEASGKNSKLYKDYKQRDPSITPEKYTQLIKGAITQTKDNNPYKRYYRDLYPSKIDIEAPAAIIDTRIQPQALMEYRAATVPSSEKAKRFLKNSSTQYYQSELSEGPAGMASAFYYYDPIAITPWDILTESQKKERVKKYGVTGTPLPNIKKFEKSKPKTLQFMPMRGMTSIPMEQLIPQKTNVPKTNLVPAQYMDTRGEWSSIPQVPPGYTEEQLLKMGYRAPRKKKNGGWLDNL